MIVPSVSMKSAFGMALSAPGHGGNPARGLDHVTLRHSAILLIALVACRTSRNASGARHGRFGQCRTTSPAANWEPFAAQVTVQGAYLTWLPLLDRPASAAS